MFKLNTTTFAFLLLLLAIGLLFSCHDRAARGTSTGEDEHFTHLIDQSRFFQSRYSFDTALIYSDSAFFYAKSLNDKDKLATSLLRKGTVFKNANLPDSAKVYLFRGRAICLQTGNLKKLSSAESTIGKVYKRLGESDSAVNYLQSAIRIKEEIGDSLGLALSLNSLGNILSDMSKFDDALKQYMRAEGIFQQIGDLSRHAYTLLNIGNIYFEIDENRKALELYKQCKEKSRLAGNRDMYIVSLSNIANIYYKLEQYQKAEQAYLEVIELNKSTQDDEGLALNYANLASVYAGDLKQELSFESINKALNLAKRSQNKEIEIQAYNFLGIYYSRNGDLNAAEEYYKKTVALAKSFDDIAHLSIAYNNLSLLSEKKKDFEDALAYFKLSTVLQDSIINEKKLEIILDLESKYEKKKNEAEIFRLSKQNAEQEIRNKDMKISMISAISLVVFLLGTLFYFRLKSRKDKIIDRQRIRQLEEERKLLAAQAVLVGQENERKRIAQELHDGIGVLLSTASMHFTNVQENSADKKSVKLLEKANQLLKRASGEVRKISHNMMPGVLSKFGLQEALEDLFENVEDAGKIAVDYVVELKGERMEENTEIMLYRIVQEMLNNTLKHARATKIVFSLRKEKEALIIQFSDNGKGFDPNEIKLEKSLGLSGIRSRVDFLKGDMTLEAEPGKGARYDISIPLA